MRQQRDPVIDLVLLVAKRAVSPHCPLPSLKDHLDIYHTIVVIMFNKVLTLARLHSKIQFVLFLIQLMVFNYHNFKYFLMQLNWVPCKNKYIFKKKKNQTELRGIDESKPVIKLKVDDSIVVIWPGMSSSKGIVDCSTDLLKDVAAKGHKKHQYRVSILQQLTNIYATYQQVKNDHLTKCLNCFSSLNIRSIDEQKTFTSFKK